MQGKRSIYHRVSDVEKRRMWMILQADLDGARYGEESMTVGHVVRRVGGSTPSNLLCYLVVD